MILSRLLLAATLLSGYEGSHAFVPNTFVGAKPRPTSSSVRAPTSELHAKNIHIIGGGIAGLSIAHYLALEKEKGEPDAQDINIIVYDKRSLEPPRGGGSTSASFAAAGILGAQLLQNEGSPYHKDTTLFKLCEQSIINYLEWTNEVESGAREYYLRDMEAANNLLWESVDGTDSISVRYKKDHGCLGPKVRDTIGGPPLKFPTDTTSNSNQRKEDTLPEAQERLRGEGVDAAQLNVLGKWWWAPWSGTVDARRLVCCLRASCKGKDVRLRFGKAVESITINKDKRQATRINLAGGGDYSLNTDGVVDEVVVANGGRLSEIMINTLPEDPIYPVRTVDGESSIKQVPSPTRMTRPVISYNAYVIPNPDGNEVLAGSIKGSTDDIVEESALWPETIALGAVRPRTEDSNPLLGRLGEPDSPTVENLSIAGGYNCYGMLIAPKAGQLIGDLVLGRITFKGPVDPNSDQDFLREFMPSRVPPPSKGDNKKIACVL